MARLGLLACEVLILVTEARNVRYLPPFGVALEARRRTENNSLRDRKQALSSGQELHNTVVQGLNGHSAQSVRSFALPSQNPTHQPTLQST
jgi:hypothetical protein